MFAEFEMIVHDKVGRGEAVTCEQLKEIYYDLNKKYFGHDIVVDELIAMEWAGSSLLQTVLRVQIRHGLFRSRGLAGRFWTKASRQGSAT